MFFFFLAVHRLGGFFTLQRWSLSVSVLPPRRPCNAPMWLLSCFPADSLKLFDIVIRYPIVPADFDNRKFAAVYPVINCSQ